MKRSLNLVLLSGFLLNTMAYSKNLSLRADEWCPFNCVPKSDKPGYLIEIAEQAFKTEGFSIDYSTLNWSRAILESRNGKYNGIVGAFKSDAPDFVFPNVPLGKVKNCFYTDAKSTWKFDGLKSLKGQRIGLIQDYSYDEEFDKYAETNKENSNLIDIVSGDEPLSINIKKVKAGRISALLESQSVLEYYLYDNQLEPLRLAGCFPKSSDKDVYIAFSPAIEESKQFSETLAQKVQEMRKDGSLAKLLTKYGIKDWED